jgi:predicted nucleic acid-binding protein
MRVFVDTSALYALIDESDAHHDDAASQYRRLLGEAQLVTTNYVLVEADQLIRRRLGNEAGDRLRDALLPPVSIVWVDEATHQSALEAQRSGGAEVSLVDHVSFVVMQRMAIAQALAFDADFEARGFGLPQPETPLDHRLSEERAPYGSVAALAEPPLPAPVELVSVAEISARSGRPSNTIQSWRRRHADFPAPMATLAAGPVWHWADVARWIVARGPAHGANPLGPGVGESTRATRSPHGERQVGHGHRS